jgi:small subunit ribosomal protein S18
MSTSEETQQRSISPAEIPYSTPEAFKNYTTDTGKILPRKYTRLSAKEQRRVTKTIKRARNLLFAQ